MRAAFTADDVLDLTAMLHVDEITDGIKLALVGWLEHHIPTPADAFALLHTLSTSSARWIREMSGLSNDETVFAILKPTRTLDENAPALAVGRMLSTAVNGDMATLRAVITAALNQPEEVVADLLIEALIAYRGVVRSYIRFKRETAGI